MNVLICISSLPHAHSTVTMGGLVARALGRPVSLLKVITDAEEAETAAITLEEVQALIEEPRDKTKYTILMNCGLRGRSSTEDKDLAATIGVIK